MDDLTPMEVTSSRTATQELWIAAEPVGRRSPSDGARGHNFELRLEEDGATPLVADLLQRPTPDVGGQSRA